MGGRSRARIKAADTSRAVISGGALIGGVTFSEETADGAVVDRGPFLLGRSLPALDAAARGVHVTMVCLRLGDPIGTSGCKVPALEKVQTSRRKRGRFFCMSCRLRAPKLAFSGSRRTADDFGWRLC